MFALIQELVSRILSVISGEVPRTTAYGHIVVYNYHDGDTITAVKYEGYRDLEVNTELGNLGCTKADYGPGGENVRVCENIELDKIVDVIRKYNKNAWLEIEMYIVSDGGQASLMKTYVGLASEVLRVPSYV